MTNYLKKFRLIKHICLDIPTEERSNNSMNTTYYIYKHHSGAYRLNVRLTCRSKVKKMKGSWENIITQRNSFPEVQGIPQDLHKPFKLKTALHCFYNWNLINQSISNIYLPDLTMNKMRKLISRAMKDVFFPLKAEFNSKYMESLVAICYMRM